MATLYTVSPHKDIAGVERDGILPTFQGILSHDHDRKYYHFGSAHATCGAHLLRELKGLAELWHIDWASKFREFYASINNYKTSCDIESCDPVQLESFEHTYDDLVAEGFKVLSEMTPNSFGAKQLSPILNRLRDFKDSYLLFIRNYDAPFTNNQAERDLRMCKTKQKVSGSFRTLKGLTCYATIRSFISTAKKQSLDLFSSVKMLFGGSLGLMGE
jgi:transposase